MFSKISLEFQRTYTDIDLGNFVYLVIDYLFTISQDSQTPSTTGQPSIRLQISTDSNSLGVVSICDVWVT